MIDVVWEKFNTFVARYRTGTSPWNRPIAAGWNIYNFDLPIVERICASDPYKLGPVDKGGKPNLFHPRDIWDMQKTMSKIVENFPSINTVSLDGMRNFFGIPESNGHNALVDSLESAAILCRFVQHFRRIYSAEKLQGTMANFQISDYL